MNLIVYNYYPDTGIYLGSEEADESPLESGIYLIPAHATDIEPPPQVEGKYIKFNIDLKEWFYEDIPIQQEENKPELTLEEIKNYKISELNTACNQEILSGYKSSVKDIEQHYDFDYDTQTNMLAIQNKIILNKILALPAPEIKWYYSGETVCKTWTTDEFLKLCDDADIFKTNRIDTYKALKAQVLNSTTKDEVSSIVWTVL